MRLAISVVEPCRPAALTRTLMTTSEPFRDVDDCVVPAPGARVSSVRNRQNHARGSAVITAIAAKAGTAEREADSDSGSARAPNH